MCCGVWNSRRRDGSRGLCDGAPRLLLVLGGPQPYSTVVRVSKNHVIPPLNSTESHSKLGRDFEPTLAFWGKSEAFRLCNSKGGVFGHILKNPSANEIFGPQQSLRVTLSVSWATTTAGLHSCQVRFRIGPKIAVWGSGAIESTSSQYVIGVKVKRGSPDA